MNHQDKNLDWIQLLRGIAALLVVLVHARYALLNTDSFPLAQQLFVPGAMGVDLFFLISGFIMCYSTATSDGSVGAVLRFAIKRFARVWPVYVAVTLLAVFLLYGGVDYFHLAENRKRFWHSIAMLPFNPHYPPYFSLTLQVGWTLVFEMYFYLVFAVSMLFRRLRWFALGSWVLLSVVLLPLSQRGFDFDVTRDLGYAGYMSVVTNGFVLEFLAGVLAGWLYLQPWFRLRNAQVCWHLAGASTAFALWAIYSFAVDTHGPNKYGWPLALMLLCLALASKTVRLPAPRFLLWLGTISYSLYLTHLVSQGLVNNWLTKAGLAPLAHSWGFMFLSTALALPLAALSHRYLEQGLSEIVRRGLLRLLPDQTPALKVVAPPVQAAREA